ncbi:MFS transporter (plasmid) [Embleya sp. NBC_00888]|uniref:MFS transporter n=1 Tax=Embleya sp. NBC_00888 TaxID=2975960 RepID=UPI002F9139B1|nr:MFS transporter [Embleya sp. NBC_00888]
MNQTATPARAGTRTGPTITALAIISAVSALQQSVVVPILPRLENAFDASLASVSWALTVSLLVGAIATPIAGRLGDMLGHKRVLIGVMALLVSGSIVGAVATSLPMFIIARVLQGASAAVMPLAIGLLRSNLPPRRMGFGIGIVAATVGAGNGLGLLLAGVMSNMVPGYKPLFWIIVGLAALSLLLAIFGVPASPERSSTGKLDVPGAILLSGALVALLLAIGQGAGWGWGSVPTISLFIAAVMLGGCWVIVERRVSSPLVDIAMLSDRRTVGATLASFFLGFGLFGAFVLVPSYVEHPAELGFGFGASVLGASVFLLPTTAIMLAISLLSGRLTKRFSASWIVALGAAFTALALVSLACWHSNQASVYLATAILGLGIGLSFAALGTMSVEHVPAEMTATANGINSLARMVGGSIASPVVTAILTASATTAAKGPAVGGYVTGFAITATGAAAAALVAAVAARMNRKANTPAATASVGESARV